MRPHTLMTSTGRRALVQFAQELRLSSRFSTSRLAMNATATPAAAAATTTDAAAAPKKVETDSINHLLSQGTIQKPVFSALTSLGFQKLTPVQDKSIHPVLSTDKDFVMKAKTGTGKTLAFGIPLIETVMAAGHYQGVVGVVVAPTRDLAFQIRDELDKVVRHKEVSKHTNRKMRVQTIVGGENRFSQIKAFTDRRNPVPSILVATPGRLLDVMREPEVAEALQNLEVLVLDEADRLLGEGFKEDLVEISDQLKSIRSRAQNENELKTMLYSATMDKEILGFSKRILRPDFKFIDTVDPNAPETHEKINQSLILTDDIFESYVSTILFIENESKRIKNFKAIVFLPTIKSVSYFYELLSNRLRHRRIRLSSYQLHGQLSQSTRDRSVREFRNAFSGVLVCSDVGARGMDFPNVTNVIQIGLPSDATNYVHRVGRTARGGNTGNAVIILTQAESKFMRVLKSRNVKVSSQFEYEKSPEDEAEIAELSQTVRHKYTLDLVIESLTGFSKGAVKSYRLNFYDLLAEYTAAYGKFVQDESKKPHVTHSFATRVLGLGRDAHEFFDFSSNGAPAAFEERGASRQGGFRRNDSRDGQRSSSFSRDRNDGGFREKRQYQSNYNNDNTQRWQQRGSSRGKRDNNFSRGRRDNKSKDY